MAADKKSKKQKKARKKAEKKAEKRARKEAKKAARQAEKQAARTVDKRPAREAKRARKMATATAEPARKAATGTSRPAKAPARRLRERRQPETLRLRSASPSFTVNDLEKSLAFYRDVLGFTEKERWERDGAVHGVELVAGSVAVFLSQDDWEKGRDRAKGQGFRLYCDTAQDVDTLARLVQERGGTLAEEPKDQEWGGRDFAVVDPDGFKITISSES